MQSGSQEALRKGVEEHHAMGYILRKRGDYQGAILRYSQALEAQPGHFSALFNRGFSYDKVTPHVFTQADKTSWHAGDMRWRKSASAGL